MQLKLSSTLFAVLYTNLFVYSFFVVDCSDIYNQVDVNFKLVANTSLKMEVKNCRKLNNVVIYGYVNRSIDLWSNSDFSKNFLIDLKSGSCFAYVKVNSNQVDKINYILYFESKNKSSSIRSTYEIKGKKVYSKIH